MHTNTRSNFVPLARSIAVLVAGHRWARLSRHTSYQAGDGPAFAKLDEVLGQFAQIGNVPVFADALFPLTLYRPGATSIRVLTGQADGVDQHAIDTAIKLGIPVDLLVPDSVLPKYQALCARKVAFGCPLDTLQTDDAPFAMRDELALSYADMLVAVWDGDPARGTAGGVVRLIQRAVLAGLPVLWIDLAGKLRNIDADRLTEPLLYRLGRPEPEAGLLRSLFVPCDAHEGVLIESLRQRLDPLDSKRVVPNEESELLARYVGEREGITQFDSRAGTIQDLMTALFSWNRPAFCRGVRKMLTGAPMTAYLGPAGHDPLADECRGEAPDDAPDPPPDDESQAPPNDLRVRFEWSDVRANMAGGKHRSSTWLLYLLSATAVFVAVAGVLKIGVGWTHCEYVWSGLEAACILVIVGTVFWSKRKRWHRCWLGHRFIAEQIRYLVMMQLFLATPAPFREPLFIRTDSPRKGLCLCSAELWLLQRSLSTQGLPTRYNGYELASANPVKLGRYLCYVIKHQSTFHKGTRKRVEKLEKHMRWTVRGLFAAAAIGVVLHFVLHDGGPLSPNWLLFLTAFCPAMAASLHGIATKLEIERIAAQSQQVRSRLVALATVVSRAIRHPASHDWASMVRLRADALEVATLLSQENEQWRNLIRHQVTEIPA